MGGKVVQLVQGKQDNKKVEIEDPTKLIQEFKQCGMIQLIDLDAAIGTGNNYDLIKMILAQISCRVGGGIRTIEKAQEVLALGADKVIIGSSAYAFGKINHAFLKELNKVIPPEKIILAIDSFKGEIVVKGWKESTKLKVEHVIKDLEPYCSEFLATYVDKEGMMEGTNVQFFKMLRSMTTNEITAAGGITTLEEVKELTHQQISVALGMAIYTGKLRLKDILNLQY
jgi:phosphoribosylformimino-5-aminoimidazole carboxamide ribotide isomerase